MFHLQRQCKGFEIFDIYLMSYYTWKGTFLLTDLNWICGSLFYLENEGR